MTVSQATAAASSYCTNVALSAMSAGSWIGRKVQVAAGSAKTWATAAFKAIAHFFTQAYSLASKYTSLAFHFASNHTREIGLALGGVAGALGLLYLFGGCCSNSAEETPKQLD